MREDTKRARSDYQVQTKMHDKQLKVAESELITCRRDLDQARKQLGVTQQNLATEREKRIAAESARKAILRALETRDARLAVCRTFPAQAVSVVARA